MTDSKTPGRKTLGIKTAATGAPRKATRPVRISDLNRKRVQEVVTGIKQARDRAAEKDKSDKGARRKAAPTEGAPRQDRPARPARPRPAEGERAPRRFEGERSERPRRFDGERSERPRRFEGEGTDRPRRFGDDNRAERPRRFEGERTERPRRFEGEGTDRPRRFEGQGTDRPRRFEGQGADRPRRFEGEGSDRPRRFGDDNRADRPRRFEGERTDRPRRFGDDEAPRRGIAPARRFSDSADRARPARADRPERAERPARRDAAPQPAAEPREDGLVRLSKRMSELGLCSRREADEWIPRGWVLVDGEPVTELGTRVRPDAEIEIRQEARSEQGERVTVLLNKPVGYVSGQAEDGYEPAAVLFTADNQWQEDPTRKRFAPWQRKNLAPAGRLDIDSTGLLVLTQDGRIARALIGDDSTVEKEYLVRVVWESPQGPVERDISAVFPEDQIERLRFGLSLDGVALKPAKVSWQNEEQLRFVLREGRKRQIRRMCEQVGLKVVGLKRVRMGRIALGDLPPGQWRFLGQFEKF